MTHDAYLKTLGFEILGYEQDFCDTCAEMENGDGDGNGISVVEMNTIKVNKEVRLYPDGVTKKICLFCEFRHEKNAKIINPFN